MRKCLHFDDKLRRNRNDKLAPIRYIVELFNGSLKEVYTPGPLLCVDEQLIEYHGRVAFRQYIPTKPGKFGIKVFWLVDAENNFPLKCLFYIGGPKLSEKEKNNANSIPEAVVFNICEDYLSCGRNITIDNWFTSGNLAERLLDHRTTLMGTIRRNSRHIPPAAKCTDSRRRKDCRHYGNNKHVLCSFWEKANAPVLLLYTMHSNLFVLMEISLKLSNFSTKRKLEWTL